MRISDWSSDVCSSDLKEVLDKMPGVENADYEIAEVEHTTEALTKLFKGAKVVCNMVGPFMKYGPEAVEAALAAGCHYTDTNGEQNRSDERRGGKEWVSTGKSRWAPYH